MSGFRYNRSLWLCERPVLQIVAFCVTYAAEPSNTLLTQSQSCLQ